MPVFEELEPFPDLPAQLPPTVEALLKTKGRKMFCRIDKRTLVNVSRVQAVTIDEDMPKRVRIDFIGGEWIFTDFESAELAQEYFDKVASALNWADK